MAIEFRQKSSAERDLEEFRRLKEERREYMRRYMIDHRKAKALGVTVKEYRDGQKRD